MGGTSEGAKKAAATRINRYGLDVFRNMGRKGRGVRRVTGFALKSKEEAARQGKIGAEKRWGKKDLQKEAGAVQSTLRGVDLARSEGKEK
jgi:hypothetical protein